MSTGDLHGQSSVVGDTRDDNGSAGHGSSGSTNLSGSHDPLTHDQVNKIPGYFVALMMFDFESTFT